MSEHTHHNAPEQNEFSELLSQVLDREPEYLTLVEGQTLVFTQIHFNTLGNNAWGFISGIQITPKGPKAFRMLGQQALVTRLLTLQAFDTNFNQFFSATYQGTQKGPNGRNYKAYMCNMISNCPATRKLAERIAELELNTKPTQAPFLSAAKKYVIAEDAPAAPERKKKTSRKSVEAIQEIERETTIEEQEQAEAERENSEEGETA